MLTFKNGQISLYCHFNKIIKGSGTSLQSPELRQNNVRDVCHFDSVILKFHFDSA